jgi:hypothetical protein
MKTRRIIGERWWGGYFICLEEGADGFYCRLRREAIPPEPWRWFAGPFATEALADEAAVFRIQGLERQRREKLAR